MIIKTKAILLHHVRHSDNSLIAHFYTSEYGRLSVMVKGLSSKKSTAKYLYFQPLHIFDAEIYYRETRELHTLKEVTLSFTPVEIPADILKSTISIFISEVLYSVIKEEDINRHLYSFIESSVITLDSIKAGVSNFHLWFLGALSAFIGIGPTVTTRKDSYFDMMSGQFVPYPPLHSDYLEPQKANTFNRLLQSTIEELPLIEMSGEERAMLLEKILKYYNLHLPGMRRIRSLQILNEVFR